MMRYYAFSHPMMGFGFGGVIMAIICGLIIAAIIIIIIRAARHRHYRMENKTDAMAPENSALKILNERYAKGEISDEEYKAKKTNLL